MVHFKWLGKQNKQLENRNEKMWKLKMKEAEPRKIEHCVCYHPKLQWQIGKRLSIRRRKRRTHVIHFAISSSFHLLFHFCLLLFQFQIPSFFSHIIKAHISVISSLNSLGILSFWGVENERQNSGHEDSCWEVRAR